MERRVVTVWCPDWAVVAAGVDLATPAIVLHANRVIARSPAAGAQGVAPGQRRRQAQQRCPDARLIAHDPDRDARAFESVLVAVGRFTSRLDVVEPGWVCVDARGPSRYFGGDQRLADHLVDAVTTAVAATLPGLTVRVGIADGRFASALAARHARTPSLVIAPGRSPAFLSPLPIGELQLLDEVDAELVGLFARLGLHRLGDLSTLTLIDVEARFGPPGAHAHRLASGRDRRPVRGDEPPQPRHVAHSFDEPVTELTTLAFVGKHLADRLAADLAGDGVVCTRLVVTAETEHGERSERAWYRASGMSAAAMMERVRWQLASWTSGVAGPTAGVILLRLTPDEVRRDDGEQPGLWGGRTSADERAMRTITRLSGMVGDDAVLVPAWHGGRLPVDRYEWVPAATTDLTDGIRRVKRDDTPWPGSLPAPSPAVVPATSRPAVLADDDGEPVTVNGRGELSADPATLAVDDAPPRAVVGWSGAWPLDECWWDPARHRRAARLQVLTDDGAAHLVLAEHRRWWVAATYG